MKINLDKYLRLEKIENIFPDNFYYYNRELNIRYECFKDIPKSELCEIRKK